VLTKSIGSANSHNVVRATFTALRMLRDPAAVARLRGQGSRGDADEEISHGDQLRRAIDKKQGLALQGLGLRRIRHQVAVEDTPSIRGLILKVRHLVVVTDTETK